MQHNIVESISETNNEQSSHGLWVLTSAGLKMPIHVHFFRRAILIRKVDQTDLVFGMRSGRA